MMWGAISVILIFAAALGFGFWFALRATIPEERPCYRCGGVAEVEFMGLHYCDMCRQVVTSMLSTVQHDPPYGFPGAKGYLEFPEKEVK